MKSTIKEELETKYLKKELLNDNTLLLYEQNEDNTVTVKMRYIESRMLREEYVALLSSEEYKEGNRIRVNEDHTALAVFKKTNGKDMLRDFYDLEDHIFRVPFDFVKCAYNMKFNNDNNENNENFQYTKNK